MTTEKPWLMSDADLAKEQAEFIKDYIMDSGGQIFRSPLCAGYWLYGVEFDKNLGWLGFEFDESKFDPDDEKQHKQAIDHWKRNLPLPKNYYRIDERIGIVAFKNACKKWGQDWFDRADLPMLDEVLQWTLLGEQRYE